MSKLFEDLKVGDEVFVVNQQQRHAKGDPAREMLPIAKIGRMYGYVWRHRRQEPFRLSDGKSHHNERKCNARANGLGFAVYPSEERYWHEMQQEDAAKLLKERLLTSYGALRKFKPATVAAIHKALDELGDA